MRTSMLKNPFFDLGKSFQELDADQKGHLTAEDLIKFLSANSEIEHHLVFQRFNKRSQPDKVNYAEFIEEITPKFNMPVR